MIPSNLKIGNTFTLDGLSFEVIGFDYEGRYVAQRVEGKPSAPVVAKPTVIEEKVTDYDSMSIKELQAMCKEKGLIVRGSKSEVIERLKGAE